MELTPARLALLAGLRRQARFREDEADTWRIDLRGDCEDIVLAWREEIAARDPELAAATRPAMVRATIQLSRRVVEKAGARHVVLLVAAKSGEFFMDPQSSALRERAETAWIAEQGIGGSWTMK